MMCLCFFSLFVDCVRSWLSFCLLALGHILLVCWHRQTPDTLDLRWGFESGGSGFLCCSVTTSRSDGDAAVRQERLEKTPEKNNFGLDTSLHTIYTDLNGRQRLHQKPHWTYQLSSQLSDKTKFFFFLLQLLVNTPSGHIRYLIKFWHGSSCYLAGQHWLTSPSSLEICLDMRNE